MEDFRTKAGRLAAYEEIEAEKALARAARNLPPAELSSFGFVQTKAWKLAHELLGREIDRVHPKILGRARAIRNARETLQDIKNWPAESCQRFINQSNRNETSD